MNKKDVLKILNEYLDYMIDENYTAMENSVTDGTRIYFNGKVMMFMEVKMYLRDNLK